MDLISCRAGFIAAATFGPTMTQHPPADPVYGYSRNLSGRWLLLHGYHTTSGAAEESYSIIEKALPGVLMTGGLWPGGDIAVDFPLAIIRARESGWRLADILCGQNPPHLVHIQTHSLGARIALTMLASGAVDIGDVILSAPAVDIDSLNTGGEFVDAALHCRSLTIAFSRNDRVLAVDYPLGTFGHHALGLNGPLSAVRLPANVRFVDFSRVVNAHGGYRFCTEYYQLWKSVIDASAPFGLTVV